jgi:putative salt-induced outer membrane protein YdiY
MGWHKLLVCGMLAHSLLGLPAAGWVFGQEPELGHRWRGDVGLGYTKTSGNTSTSSLALTLDASRAVERWAIFSFQGDYFGATSEGETTTNKGHATARLDAAHTERVGYFGEMGIAFDQFKELEMRLAPGVGAFYILVPNEERKLHAIAGVSWVRDYFTDETAEDRVMLRLGDTFRWAIAERSSFEQSFDIYFDVEGFSGYIFHAEAAVRADVNDRLFLKFAVIDDYDNEPLSGAIKKNDLSLVTTLNYAF